jgi:hypothetical protein
MRFPCARLSKYSTKPTPAFAVHDPGAPSSSIGEHHNYRQQ